MAQFPDISPDREVTLRNEIVTQIFNTIESEGLVPESQQPTLAEFKYLLISLSKNPREALTAHHQSSHSISKDYITYDHEGRPQTSDDTMFTVELRKARAIIDESSDKDSQLPEGEPQALSQLDISSTTTENHDDLVEEIYRLVGIMESLPDKNLSAHVVSHISSDIKYTIEEELAPHLTDTLTIRLKKAWFDPHREDPRTHKKGAVVTHPIAEISFKERSAAQDIQVSIRSGGKETNLPSFTGSEYQVLAKFITALYYRANK